MADVFISYKREDREWAARLDEGLRATGCSTWWDTSLLAGEHFNAAIDRELRAAKCVFVIWSARSANSEWVNAEAVSGFERSILVAGRIDDVALRYPFGIVQTVDLRLEGGVTNAIDGVRAKLNALAVLSSPSRQSIRQDATGSAPSKSTFSNGHKVAFVSYPKDIAPLTMKRLVTALMDRGFRIWLYDPSPYGFSDSELERISWQRGGGHFLNQTLDAVRTADAVLFLMSPWTLQSQFQKNELSVALKHGRFVPCIVHDDLSFAQLPPELRRRHVIKITESVLNSDAGRVQLKMLTNDVANAAMGTRETVFGKLVRRFTRIFSTA